MLNFTDKVLQLMFRIDCIAQTKPSKSKIRTFSVVFVRGPSIHAYQLQLTGLIMMYNIKINAYPCLSSYVHYSKLKGHFLF